MPDQGGDSPEQGYRPLFNAPIYETQVEPAILADNLPKVAKSLIFWSEEERGGNPLAQEARELAQELRELQTKGDWGEGQAEIARRLLLTAGIAERIDSNPHGVITDQDKQEVVAQVYGSNQREGLVPADVVGNTLRAKVGEIALKVRHATQLFNKRPDTVTGSIRKVNTVYYFDPDTLGRATRIANRLSEERKSAPKEKGLWQSLFGE